MSLRKIKKKGQDVAPVEEEDIISKTDLKIVDFLKTNIPTKRTKFLHQQVDYFCANKAVDVLLDSQWATGSEEPMFTDRESCVDYLDRLLNHKFFHRAKKIAITDKDLKPKELKKKREREEREKARRKKRIETAEDSEDLKKEEIEREERKKKKKIKLDMHLEQIFVDGPDAYVWMYEPKPFWYNLAGAGLLLAVVGMCLFPLWPPVVRLGVYYLSMSAAGFLCCIMGLAVLRTLLFMAIWCLSVGRHHFWLLPNLTKDVGFFESFWPVYEYEYRGSDYAELKKKKRKAKKAALAMTDEETKAEETNKEDTEAPDTDRPVDSVAPSDSESQTFEMVEGEVSAEASEGESSKDL